VWSPFRDYNYSVHRLLESKARQHLRDFHGRVLDLGCGDSPYRGWLPPTAVHVGVDRVAWQAVDVVAAGERLPFADAVFDAAMCTEVIAHARRPWEVLAEVSRVLRPGGKLYLTAPFDWHLMPPHDYYRFTSSGLRVLLEDAGFDVQSIEEVGGLFSALAGKLIESTIDRMWLQPARRLGVKRGAYAVAAVAALPLNVMAVGLRPALDRISTRNPFGFAVLARRRAS
jgi:SAM-dependent methyltransferase